LILRKVVLDTNVYVDWFNEKLHEGVVLAPGLVRYLYRVSKRVLVPSAGAFDEAGRALAALRARGVDVRRASIVNDVLIAQSARAVGATVITRDRDYETIRTVLDFRLQIIAGRTPTA
jgi:predicted nucleic acid-binding protein